MQKCDHCGAGYDPNLSESFRDVLNLMDEMRWELRAALRHSKAEYQKNGDPVVRRHNKLLGREVNAFVKAFSAFASEYRKWEKEQRDSVANMSLEQKAELILSMLEDFPRDLQMRVFHGVERLMLPAGIEDGELA